MYYITVESFGSECPENWEEIAAFLNDIIDQRGIPVERSTIGLPPRRCLLCHNEARYCMRNHSHTREEVLQRIKEMVENYV